MNARRTKAARWIVRFSLLSLAPAAELHAQGGTPSPLAPANSSAITYCPPERLALGPPTPEQRVNVFLPTGTPPAEGWPVVITTPHGGKEPSRPRNALWNGGATQRFWQLVDAGLAVVDFGATAVGAGQGMWYPPGHPSGRYESFRPSDDTPEKEAGWVIQWVKTQTQFPLDPDRIGTWGRSSGAMMVLQAAMGPDGARAAGSAQVRASTRVRALAALQPPTSIWAFEQGPDLGHWIPQRFERIDRPGVPAATLDQVAEDLQKGFSLMGACFDGAAQRANSERQAVCLVYGDPMFRLGGQPLDTSFDATGFPIVYDVLVPPHQHDQWFGQVLWRRLTGLSAQAAAFHAEHSVFAVRDAYALPAPNDVYTRTFAGTFLGPDATALVRDWLVRELTAVEPPPPPPGGGGGTPGEVLSFAKVSRTSGGGPPVRARDQYGSAADMLGDVDGDGLADLAVGALYDDDGGATTSANLGAVWIHFLAEDGTVRATSKISRTSGGFPGDLDPGDGFGTAIAGLGDFNGDGTPDLAVGSPLDDDGGTDQGALWILILNPDGSVKNQRKISATQGGLPAGLLDPQDRFGTSIAVLGDLDGNGAVDLAVGAPRDDDGGRLRGAVYVLFLNRDATVAAVTKISSTSGGLASHVANFAQFGTDLANLGDRDGNGAPELAVGAPAAPVGSQRLGAVHVLFLRPNGSVEHDLVLSEGLAGFTGDLDVGDDFGASVGALDDLDGDGNDDLVVGAPFDDDGAAGDPLDRGAVWVLFLRADGTVAGHQKISDTGGGFAAALQNGDRFGSSVARTRDWNADGVADLYVGAGLDDDGGPDCGGVYLLHVNDGTLASTAVR